MNTRIIEIRKRAKINQEEFGARIGITKSAVSKIEKGENALTDKNIKLICREFNINEEWLRTGKGEMIKTEDELLALLGGELDTLNNMDKKFITNYLKLGPKYRTLFIELLTKMVD